MKKIGSIVMVFFLLGGCSVLLTRGPGPQTISQEQCSTSEAPVVADYLLAVGYVVLAVAIARAPGCEKDCWDGDPPPKAAFVVPAASLAVLSVLSASVGVARVSACRALPARAPAGKPSLNPSATPPSPSEPPASALLPSDPGSQGSLPE